ncbi:MAG: MYXO-CTERM sorting domain-containing protein, partial [Bacteroidota bacterium]
MATKHEIRHDRIAQRVYERAGAGLRDRRRVKTLVEDKMRRSQQREAELAAGIAELETGDELSGRAYRFFNRALDYLDKLTGYLGIFGLLFGWLLRRRHWLLSFLGSSFLLSPEEL